MRDIPSIKFFIRDGRQHVQEWIGFLQGHSRLLALVPVFQPGLSLEENVRNLRDAGWIDKKATGIRWHQGDYLYSGDVALLFLVAQDKDRKAFIAYLDAIRERYDQRAYVLWDGDKSLLVTAEGQRELPPFTGSLDSLDELAGYLIPGWRTEGNFDRSMSYVQMRDYQTRPKPGPANQPGQEGGKA